MVDARGLKYPGPVAVDTSATPNRIYVVDSSNSRVLGWKDAAGFANGAPANIVIGQPNFYSYDCNQLQDRPGPGTLCFPLGVAVDPSGNLYVTDPTNDRVLEYDARVGGQALVHHHHGAVRVHTQRSHIESLCLSL
jgi:DNA-binding beta-propeller fold protein YncE